MKRSTAIIAAACCLLGLAPEANAAYVTRHRMNTAGGLSVASDTAVATGTPAGVTMTLADAGMGMSIANASAAADGNPATCATFDDAYTGASFHYVAVAGSTPRVLGPTMGGGNDSWGVNLTASSLTSGVPIHVTLDDAGAGATGGLTVLFRATPSVPGATPVRGVQIALSGANGQRVCEISATFYF